MLFASPFDPEAGFNVGNAMARNKVIYALADYAVVVNSSLNEGGTWSGATEQLEKFKQIPVFIRSGADTPAGNRALIERGGIPLEAIPNSGLRRCFNEAAKQHRNLMAAEELLLNL